MEAAKNLAERLMSDIEEYGDDFAMLQKEFIKFNNDRDILKLMDFLKSFAPDSSPAIRHGFDTSIFPLDGSLIEIDNLLGQLYKILHLLKIRNGANFNFSSNNEIYLFYEFGEIPLATRQALANYTYTNWRQDKNKKIIPGSVRDSRVKKVDNFGVPDFIFKFAYLKEYEELQRAALETRIKALAVEHGGSFDPKTMVLQIRKEIIATVD